MAKVTQRNPNVLSLLYQQEKSDEDYGSCTWAIFNFDLDRYELSITSSLGCYAYRWFQTTESFMHLMARIYSSYLLDKISTRNTVNQAETLNSVIDLLKQYDIEIDSCDELAWCCDHDTAQEVHDALEKSFKGTSMEDCDDYDLWGCICIDHPAQAKKIAEIFEKHIQPVCIQYIQNTKTDEERLENALASLFLKTPNEV